MENNKLIYGKNEINRIVSIEPSGNDLIIYRELEDGSVEKQVLDATYWLITNERVSSKQQELEGDQHYKYLAEFNDEQEYERVRSLMYKKRIDFYTIWDKKEQNLVRQGITYYKGMQPKDVSILSFDIETDGLVKTKNSEIYLITNTFRKKENIIRKMFSLEDYSSQREMVS